MSSEPAITLLDIPAVLDPQAWSANTWKTRILLNYKGIPYKTTWVSYPDIEPTLKKLGCSPTGTKPDDPSKPFYTLPAIIDTSNGTQVVIADSLAIAEYLEAKYPDRPVFPQKGRARDYVFMEWFWSIAVLRLVPLLLPAVHAVLDERSKVYFRETREKWYNKKLEEFSPEGPVRDAHWKALNEAFDQVAAIMEKNGPGVDFVAGGDEPTWADIFIVSYLAWIKAVLPDEWENRVKKWSGGKWATLMDKTEQWREVH